MNNKEKHVLSTMSKTYIFDLDGTILEHGLYKDGNDRILPGVNEFFANVIKEDDYVVILTARKQKYAKKTKDFLLKNNIKFDNIIFDVALGERILFNDIKPLGLKTAVAINLKRNAGLKHLDFVFDKDL